MNLTLLQNYAKKPELFAGGTASLWDDPHISQYMLEAHLNPNWDAASRKPETIDATVSWIQNNYVKPQSRVLDLGCGPGLYASRLARLGHEVTGMDFSKRSIEYARQSAKEQGLMIEYFYQNYLTLDYTEIFDAVILIYCDLGVFADAERNLLLTKIYQALKPGGVFIFDLFNDNFVQTKKIAQSWGALESGFWAAEPYLILEETFHYPEAKAFVDQYIVCTESGELKLYRCWDRYYAEEDLRQMLAIHGFRDEQFFTRILPLEEGKPADVVFTVTYK